MNAALWILAGAALAMWLLPLAARKLARWSLRQLADLPPAENLALPSVSVVLAALNEEDTVEPAMRSLLALDYPKLEIVAVDDRSTDSTGAILDRLAAEDPRLRVIHVRELPAGWLGKNHAAYAGAQEAKGEFILFTDADVHFEPPALRYALGYVEAKRIDHLAVLPELALGGFWEGAAISFFGTLFFLYAQPWKVPDPRSRAHVGVGAFNLVRAETYRRSGGYASVRMDVADDVKLGKRLKQAGARSELLMGIGLFRVRWAVGLRGVVRGLTKNTFAGLSYSLLRGIGAILGIFAMATWPAVGLFLGPIGPRLVCAAALSTMVSLAWIHRPSPRASHLYGLCYPLMGLVFVYVVLRSMVVTYWRGGVVWRGTLYPLRELRKGLV